MTNFDKSKWYQPSGPARFTQAGWVAAEYEPEPTDSTGAGLCFIFLLLLAGVLLVAVGAVVEGATAFEDGSFILGPIRGCLPWLICAL